MDIKTVLASAAASAAVVAVSVPAMVSFVTLQPASPGLTEPGHSHISGFSLASRFGAGTSPTIARVQIEETGSIQGLRASTGTGVSVYGQSNATTGLGAGGYFTSKSVNGRGLVADALSTTGNTVGGLFYNHSSSTSGVAVWGRILGTGAAGTGVFADSATTGGTALRATHGPSGNSLTAGTADDSLKTTGAIPRHVYAGGATATMVPIAYGEVGPGGAPFTAGSGNWTSVKNSTGNYTVTISGVPSNGIVTIASAIQTSGNEFASIVDSPGSVGVNVWNLSSNALTDSAFTFVTYRAGGTTPSHFEMPDELLRYGTEGWHKRDPQAFEAFRKRYVAWQRQQSATEPTTFPNDGTVPPQ